MIVLIYGEDTYRSRAKCQQIRQEFYIEHKSNFENLIFSPDNFDFLSFKNALSSQQLFTKFKIIFLNHFLGLNKEALGLIVDRLSVLKKDEKNLFVFWEENIEPSKLKEPAKSLFVSLGRLKQKEFFPPLKPYEVKDFAKKNFLSDIKIDSRALDLLVAYTGPDLWSLHNEISKLTNLEKGGIITEEAIKKLVAKQSQKIFDLIDALGLRKKNLALSLLQGQKDDGEPLDYIINLLMKQYRLISLAKTYLQEHSFIDYDELQRMASCHPYVLKKAVMQADHYTIPQLKKINQKLINLTILQRSKKIDGWVLLEMIILKLV